MLVFHKAGLTLLAVPKTGTTSLESVLTKHASVAFLDPPRLKHMPLRHYNNIILPLIATSGTPVPETMALVRHPVEQLKSWYKYRSRMFLDGSPNSTADMDFDSFVSEYLNADTKPFAKVGSQVSFVSDNTGTPSVTHLFQYENMNAAVAFLSDRLKVDIQLPRENVSPIRGAVLSDPVLRRLEIQCAAEFTLWENAISERT